MSLQQVCGSSSNVFLCVNATFQDLLLLSVFSALHALDGMKFSPLACSSIQDGFQCCDDVCVEGMLLNSYGMNMPIAATGILR